MFIDYAKRYFVGQDSLVRQIAPLIESIRSGENHNLLLMAQSGYGKTHLAKLIGRYTKRPMSMSVGELDIEAIRECSDLMLLDEVHLERNPEPLYPIMDSGSNTFLLATNEYDKLKEPLVNRCHSFIFEQYAIRDLARIMLGIFRKKEIDISSDTCLVMAEYCRKNPRVAKNIARRLALYFGYNPVPQETEAIHETMADALGLGEGGFTPTDYRYLEFLESVGGMAGLTVIKSSLNLPEKIITQEVEPFLISKNLIEISSRGRRLK